LFTLCRRGRCQILDDRLFYGPKLLVNHQGKLMNTIDEQIKKVFSKEGQEALDKQAKQAGLFEVITLSFSGRQAWFTYTIYALSFATFIAGGWMSTKFFASSDIKTSLEWLLGVIACLFGLTIIKLIGWQQMQKLEILTEIKRLEMRFLLALGEPESAA
jgi:hypothetical protein